MNTKFTKGEWYQYANSKGLGVGVSGMGICELEYSDSIIISKSENEANAHLIAAAPDMYRVIDELSSELYTLILEVNLHRSRVINSQTETEPDYWDAQSVHEAELLLAKARGE